MLLIHRNNPPLLGKRTLPRVYAAFIAVLVIALGIITAGLSTPSHADNTVDIKVQLSGPESAQVNSNFTYTLTISNIGETTALNVPVRFYLSEQVKNLAVACAEASGQAVCPASFNINTNQFQATIPKLPKDTVVTLQASGKYTDSTSVTATLEAHTPDGFIDANPDTNTAQQQTTMQYAPAKIEVFNTSAGTAITEPESHIQLSTRYTNMGSNDVANIEPVSNLSISKAFDAYGLFELTWSVSCSTASTISCPEWVASYQGSGTLSPSATVALFGTEDQGRTVSLPAGGVIEFVFNIDVKALPKTCGNSTLVNESKYNPPAGFMRSTDVAASGSAYIAVQAPTCPATDINVQIVPQSPFIANGESVMYQISYTNNSTQAAQSTPIFNYFNISVENPSSLFNYTLGVECAASSTAACPEWISQAARSGSFTSGSALSGFTAYTRDPSDSAYNEDLYVQTVDLGPGETLTLNLTLNLAVAQENCTNHAISILAGYQTPPGFDDAESPNAIKWFDSEGGIHSLLFKDEILDTRFVCTMPIVDVSTTTAVLDANSNPANSTVPSGEDLTAVSTVSNASTPDTEAAEMVAFKIQLPKGGFEVSDTVTSEIQCQSLNEQAEATCPIDWVYNEAAHTISATINKIDPGAGLQITVPGKAGIVQLDAAMSHKVSTTAPAPGDKNPTEGTLNQSDANFGVTNTKTDINLNLEISGLTDNKLPAAKQFTGTLACTKQGSYPVNITVAKNAHTATLSPALQAWRNDTCQLTLQTPATAPSGYSWGSWIKGPELSADVQDAAVTFNFAIQVNKSDDPPSDQDFTPNSIPLPLTGGLGSDTYYIAAAILAALLLVVVAVYKYRAAR